VTHTHHRRGAVESLKDDYVVLFMLDPEVNAQHIYKESLRERVKKLLKICQKYNPVALSAKSDERRLRYLYGWTSGLDSGEHEGATLDEVGGCDELLDEGLGHAVYTSKDSVIKVLSDLKKADLGISIVISGIFDEVFDSCKESNIDPHTVNMSLETWGKTELIPEGAVLEIATMCGHAMISQRLIESLIERVKKGHTIPIDAAVEMGKQCTCNIFNTVRAAKIIEYLFKAD
jgi:hypothetical protein